MRLVGEIDACFADASALSPGLRRDLLPPEIATLRRLAPALARACHELAAAGIASTLDHADLWASNVLDAATGPVIIDWEDACLSHPFFGLWFLTPLIPGLAYVSPLMLVIGEEGGGFPGLASSLMNGHTPYSWLPLVSAPILTAVFLAAGIKRFNREEF